MKKTTITLIAISIFILIGTLGVSATSGLTSIKSRAEAREKAVELRVNKLENRLIWAENVELRTEIKLKLIDIKKNEIVIEESIKTQLTELTATLKTKYAALKETKGDIKTLTDGVKALIEAKDWVALEAVYERIRAIQHERNTLLTDINELLTQVKDLLP
ncbi:MAG: hypothetical protein FD133_562 [Erysipelotrichaceae bacterium]|nr:MAG: hypothetical protein FD179_359 [Erysipelotrichaceae bacterium]TXT19023.1 MAG: hypothetical protein FD133_562 [Erysipelotrichaceae bacterium]